MLVNLCSCSRLLQGQEAEGNVLQALQEAVGTTTTATEAEPQLDDVFPHSSNSYLTEDEIADTLDNFTGETPTSNYAQDAINEIYARHGYVFQNNTIRAFYEAKPWYVADSGFRRSDLNAYEKANIELLKTFK